MYEHVCMYVHNALMYMYTVYVHAYLLLAHVILIVNILENTIILYGLIFADV